MDTFSSLYQRSCFASDPVTTWIGDYLPGMLSPRTGLGLEAQKTGLGHGLDGNGLGLETLRPRPHVIQPRGIVYCNVLISCSVATNCQFQLNIGNCHCKVSYHENQGWQRR